MCYLCQGEIVGQEITVCVGKGWHKSYMKVCSGCRVEAMKLRKFMMAGRLAGRK